MISLLDSTQEHEYEPIDYPLTFHKKCFKEWNTQGYTIGETRKIQGYTSEYYRTVLDGDWRDVYTVFEDTHCEFCDHCDKRIKKYDQDCDCYLCE